MKMRNALGAIRGCVCVAGALLALSGCYDEPNVPDLAAPPTGEQHATMASQARLWVSVANAENVYVGSDPDAWINDSWVTGAEAFDVVVTNNADFAVDDVYLLVTMDAGFVDTPGWSVTVDGLVLGPADFSGTNTDAYGFDGGSHGVYPPSGAGIFYPHPMGGTLAGQASWTVHVVAASGGIPGFRLHFDAGSTRLWSPPSHDVTANPPAGSVPATGACCLPENGGCAVMTESECVDEMGGVFQGPDTSCDPDPCVVPPEPGACCLAGGTCIFVTEPECSGASGVFHGAGVTCDLVTCGE